MNNLIVLTQRITHTSVGKLLILAVVVCVTLQAAGWADFTPEQTGMPPVDCDRLAAQLADVTTTTVANGPCR